MYTKLPSGTKAAIEKPSSGSSQLGLVVIPDVMGLRLLFEDMVKNLSIEWKMPVCSRRVKFCSKVTFFASTGTINIIKSWFRL